MHAGPPGSRRRILAFAAGALVTAAAAPASAALRFTDRRTLSFHHLHTGESLEATYWIDGHYQPRELERINRLLRDFRTGEVYPIDPELLDLLLALRRRLGSRAPFQVISGYRSPATNAMLANLTEGVSSNSLASLRPGHRHPSARSVAWHGASRGTVAAGRRRRLLPALRLHSPRRRPRTALVALNAPSAPARSCAGAANGWRRRRSTRASANDHSRP